jgi:RNA polymerase sigma-70 factor (ECF subfamily)
MFRKKADMLDWPSCRDDDDDSIWNIPAAPDDDPLTVLLREERKETIRAAINSLPEDYRVVLWLALLDIPYQEIAKMLGLSVSAVKMRIKRGKEMLKRLISEGAI